MKRWSAALLGMALSSTAFAAHGPFTGVYGGANFGVAQIQVNNNFQSTIFNGDVNVASESTGHKASDMSGAVGLALGYGFRIESMFIAALEGRANFEDFDVEYDLTQTAMGLFSASHHTDIKLDNDLALLAKLGIMFDTDVLLYGLIGPDWGNFKVEPSFRAVDSEDGFGIAFDREDHHYKAGLLLGLGLEYLVTPCTSFALEYNYTNYGHLHNIPTIEIPGDEVVDILSNDVHPRVNKFMVNFNFYFG